MNACTLVTEQDATAALGADPGPSTGAGPLCSYASSAGSLTVVVAPLDSSSGQFDIERTPAQGTPGYQDVPNVGDHAFLNLYHGTATLVFTKGATHVAIVCSATAGGPAITLAQQAAGPL